MEKAAVPPAGRRSGTWLWRTLIPDIKASRLSPMAVDEQTCDERGLCMQQRFRPLGVSAAYPPSPQARVRAASQGALRRRRGPRLDVRPMATAHHRDVWAENVDAEFVAIREAIVNYPYVAMVRRSPPHLAHATPSQRTPRHPRVAVRGTPLMLPPILSTRLSAGHRVPGGCRPSHWLLQVILRLSLPDAALQRRPSEDNPDRPHPL